MTRRGEVISLDSVREAAPADAPLPPRVSSDTVTLRDYLDVINKRRWVVLGIFVLVVGVTAAWVWHQPRIFRSQASIEISTVTPRYLGSGVQDVVDTGAGMYWQSKEFFETQYQIIRSRAVARRVVEKLGLDRDEAFLGLSRIKDAELRRKAVADADAIGKVQSMLHVDPSKDSRVVLLAVEDTDPARAALISNTYAQEFMAYNLDRRIDATRAASLWLSDQLDGLKTKLEKSETALHEFKRDNDILTASFEDKQNISSQRLLALNDALTKTRIKRAEIDARMKTVAQARKRVQHGDEGAFESLPLVAQSSTVATLKLRLVELYEERSAAAARYLEQHPKITELDRKTGEVRSALTRETDKLVRLAENDASEIIDTEGQLRALIEGAKSEALDVNQRELDYAKLKREQEYNQKLYDLVLGRLKEADLSGLLRTNNVQLLDAALVSTSPVRPNRKVALALAALIAFGLGVATAFLLEYLDDTVKTHDDVERNLQLPFLGIVPRIRDDDKGPGRSRTTVPTTGPLATIRDRMAHVRPKSAFAECLRSIRTNLLFVSPDRPLKRLLVTSSSPSEGKTTVATNIAITLAQSGARTLLVDTDMRRPRVHRAFGLSNDSGLSTLMLANGRLSELVQETEIPGLFVLPCGPLPPNPSELFHTERFGQILREMDEQFDRVVLDSPPVAAVTDPLLLSREVDGVVMVIKCGHTARDVAARTKQALVDVRARIFGVVLNDVDLDRRGYGYSYYYQRYGYEARETESSAS